MRILSPEQIKVLGQVEYPRPSGDLEAAARKSYKENMARAVRTNREKLRKGLADVGEIGTLNLVYRGF